jgi:hypothetical protein
MAEATEYKGEPKFVYRILRYTSDLVRDEWVNIGVLLIDRNTGERRLRLIEEQDEITRVQRLQPPASEVLLRNLRDHLEDRFENLFRDARPQFGSASASEAEVQELVEKWDGTLSNSVRLAPQKGLYGEDLDAELERLYAHHVAPPRRSSRVGAPGSRATIRNYCTQVWRQAGLWDRLEKGARASPFTFPGDPMRLDYVYRRNGTRGFVQTLSVSRSPADCKLYAYTAQRIAQRAPFASQFTAVTDLPLEPDNERHRFVRDTLRDAGIEPVPMEGFAVWVAKLKPLLQ